MPLRTLLLAICVSALVITGCGCNEPIPIDSVEEPVAYIARPPSTFASLVAPILPQPVSAWGDQELMLMDAATGETWRLTSNGENDLQPTWSPSGTHIMYLSRVDPAWISTKHYYRTKLEEVFIYDLKERSSRHVDLSWALESGPASAQTSTDDLLEVGWLECAAWSPVDSTQIAVGVLVDVPTPPNLTDYERRLILLDTEEKSGRLLSGYGGHCSGIKWSSDGQFFVAGKERLVTVDSRRLELLPDKRHILKGDTLLHHVLDWRRGQALIKGIGIHVDSYAVYEYDVRRKEWTEALDVLPDKDRMPRWAPHNLEEDRRSIDYIVRRDSLGSYYTDFWRYHRPEGTYERLTYDRMPKKDVTSYQGIP